MSSDLIPAHRRDDVDRALRHAFGTTAVDDLAVLRGGLSPALVYRAVLRGRPCLIRIETALDGFRDPVRHHACLAIAAEAGIAPPLLFADADAGVVITDFIEARPLGAHPGGLAGIVREIAALLARLQRTPVFPPLVDYLDGVDAVIADMLASGVLDQAATAPHFDAYRRIRDAYPRQAPAALVSGHNDLNPGNILYDGRRLWLVDWESAFANDPHADIAAAANFFGVEDGAEDALLGAVLGTTDDIGRARLRLMRQVCNMFYAAMMLTLVAAARGPEARPIADLEAPALREVRKGLGDGTVDVARPEGRLLYAKALLNEVKAEAESRAFIDAARRLAHGEGAGPATARR